MFKVEVEITPCGDGVRCFGDGSGCLLFSERAVSYRCKVFKDEDGNPLPLKSGVYNGCYFPNRCQACLEAERAWKAIRSEKR